MPAERRLPDSGTLRQLRQQGKTYDQIAEMYDVTPGAVYLQLDQAGLVKRKPSYKHLIPWTLDAKHTHARVANMLRWYGRVEAELPLPVVKKRMLDKWLTEVREKNVVVSYDTENGFFYLPREDSDGDSLIREDPKVAALSGAALAL